MICRSKKSHLNRLILVETNAHLLWIAKEKREEKPEGISKELSMLKDHFPGRVPVQTNPTNLPPVAVIVPSSQTDVSFQRRKFTFAQPVCVGSFSPAPPLYLFFNLKVHLITDTMGDFESLQQPK